jgi:toxoflavin synthase
MPSTERSSQFDRLADMYEHSIAELPFRDYIEQYSVLAALGDLTGARALDLGCGSGIYTRLLARRGARSVVGMDQSAGMIDYARRREVQEPLGVRYVLHDADSDAVPMPATCDLALAVYLLPYAPTFDALSRMCVTARTALAGHGARFVTATLNPEVATSPHYYQPYGFDLTFPNGPRPCDGDPVGLHSDIHGDSFDVTAYYWSKQRHEQALTAAGFTHITWTAPHCSPEANASDFASYLDIPHLLIITTS